MIKHARDISDAQFLSAVVLAEKLQGYDGATRWNVGAVLAGFPYFIGSDSFDYAAVDAAVPPKVVLAKARRLVRRGLLDGCTCGCRGSFERRDTPSGQSRP